MTPPTKPAYYSSPERSSFATSNPFLPPDNSHVWIATYGGRIAKAHFSTINQVRPIELYGFHVSTLVLNKVALQFMTWKGHTRTIDFAAMERDGWEHFSRRIWPPSNDGLRWPPAHHLTDSGLDAWFDRFRPRRGAS